MTDPPLSGEFHIICTLRPLITVLGAIGVAGDYAAKIVTTLEKLLNPTLFLA
jgi:hypothetical protein